MTIGRYTIVFNGEIYNHTELRHELEQRGHQFWTHCDTEVALRAFLEWDVGCFRKFRGMFSAAFWQDVENRLVLVRDRLGIKPLYYCLHQGELYFGSELKALFACSELPRALCRRALSFFLLLNYVPTPLTMVKGMYKLEPGSWLEFRSGDVTHGTYWRNVMHPQHMKPVEAEEELDHLLRLAVQDSVTADVPVGLWLSGGLDSSTLLHYAAQNRASLQTFSISFKGTSCDESRHFNALASYYGSRHYTFDLNADLDLVSVIHDLSYYSDEPCADAGAIPLWFLSKLTAQHVRVALSGEGSDELFGGYQTYLADYYSRFVRPFPMFLRQAALKFARLLPVSDEKIGVDYKLKRFLMGCTLPSDEAHCFWNGTFLDRDFSKLNIRLPTGLLCEKIQQLPRIPAVHDPNRYLFLDQHWYLPDDILNKCDRMSMAHSVEVRPPFLDHRIVEFASRLPASLKQRGRKTKVLLRRTMKNRIPSGLVNGKKEGLDIPAHAWLRGPLRPLMLEVLSERNLLCAGLFSYSSVGHLIEQHLTRKHNIGYHLWGLITLHLWIQRWKIETLNDEPQTEVATLTG